MMMCRCRSEREGEQWQSDLEASHMPQTGSAGPDAAMH